jgi:trigger factor
MSKKEQAIEPNKEQEEAVEQETTDAAAKAEAETGEEQAPEIKYTATIEEAGPCKKKVSVEVEEETIKNATDKQYETLRKEALVPGFRKGRAPRRLLEKRFGKEAMEQIKLKLLADASEAAIKDNKLDVLSEPDIDFEKIDLPETGPLKFDFEIEVRPDFDLPPLEGIPVTRTKLEVTDELVDREIERIRKWSGLWTPRESGAVELEDQVIADVILKPVSGQDAPEQSEAEEEQKLDNIDIYVRKNGFVGAIPVEKLDELLVGAKTGDVKTTSVEVPKTYFKEEFRGKKVDVQITVKEIKWLKPAEIDENFFKRFEVKDEKELRDKIHDTLHSQLEQKSRTDITEQIYNYLLDNTKFDLPVDIVADHSVSLLKRQYINLIMRGLPRQQVDEQMEQLKASSEEQAKQQFKTFFVIDKIAKNLGIDVSEEEINGHIAQLAIQQNRRPEKMREEMERDGSLAQFKLQVHEKKCIDKLLESAAITESAGSGEKKVTKKAAAKKEPKSAKKTAKEKEPKEKNK